MAAEPIGDDLATWQPSILPAIGHRPHEGLQPQARADCMQAGPKHAIMAKMATPQLPGL